MALRPSQAEKHLGEAQPLNTKLLTEKLGVASTGYEGLRDCDTTEEAFELSEMVGPRSTYKFGLIKCDDE